MHAKVDGIIRARLDLEGRDPVPIRRALEGCRVTVDLEDTELLVLWDAYSDSTGTGWAEATPVNAITFADQTGLPRRTMP